MYSFSLNGIRSEDKGIRVNNVSRDILPSATSRTIDIPDKDGAYYYKNKYNMRVITVDISIISDTFNSNQAMVRTIADFLDPSKGNRKIIFDDESDKYYMGVITGETNVPQIIKLKQGTISFLIVNPFAKSIMDEVVTIKDISTTFERASSAYDGVVSVGTNEPRYTDGLSIETGTTNLIGVSNFESGVDGWVGSTDVIISSSSESAYIGNKSLKIVYVPSGYTYKDYVSTFTAGTYYTFSGWIYALSYMVGKTVRFGVELIGGVNPDAFFYTDIVLVSGWQFCNHTVLIDYSDRTTCRVEVVGSTGVEYGNVLYLDAPQLESLSYFTTYTDGTRAYERAYLPIAESGINFNSGSMEFYVNKITEATTYGGMLEIGAFSSPVTIDRFVIFNGRSFVDGSRRFSFQISNGSTAEQNAVETVLDNTPVSGQNYYVCIRWNLASEIKIDLYDYTNVDHKTGVNSISMSAPTFSSYTNIYIGLLTTTLSSNWRFRAIKFSSEMISDSDILTSIENGYDEFTSDSRTTYLTNFINETLINTSFTRIGSAEAMVYIKVYFNAGVSEYKILQITSGKYIRVVNTFVAGDILVIDGTNNKIYINDVLEMDTLDINSEFFLLDDYECIFNIDQYADTETTLTYTPTWL